MDWPEYELIDFGEGRKLERFGAWVLDRPAPAAAGVRKNRPAAWRDATARFEGERTAAGEWTPAPQQWATSQIALAVPIHDRDLQFVMALEPLPSGQIGVFPEQLPCWQWIAERVRSQTGGGATPGPRPGLQVLNLFAYTGGSTLAAAIGGASVVHVDAAKGAAARARQNAERSGLADRPIRWIVEDALKFCRREAKRGNRYDAVILDPPTYGHGPKGEQWSVKRDLLPLLQLCGELTAGRPKFVLATCHTPGIGPAELAAYVAEGMFGHCGQPPRAGELLLRSTCGRRLASGVYARWPG
ncbi:MAG: class I SAM-dependent methyltransferase [Pirellulales bacterium]|nr:class I SAM-dependent methyltransferase [Pirellulales bacterium]